MDLINKNPWLLWVLLFFLPPVGIFLLFKTKKFNTPIRAVLTVVFCFVFIFELAVAFGEPVDKTTNPSSTVISQNITIDQENEDAAKGNENNTSGNIQQTSDQPSSSDSSTPAVASVSTPVSGVLKVHFLDVGQADSILIQSGNTAVLIDGGNNEDGSAVVNYLKGQGVTELAAIVATHPHEDHIGGLDTVIKSFTVKSVYMPNATSTSRTFEDFIAAVNSSGAKRIQAKAGVVLNVSGLSGIFLGPVSNYDDANNNSAVLKLTFSNTSFLFTGDAEQESESDMVVNGDLKSTVLKVGHHGSDTATSSSFLNAVSPLYAVISCGEGNNYGHPHAETLDKLTAAGVKIYRTDISGTIVMTSDGNTITVNKAPTPVNSPASSETVNTPTPSDTSPDSDSTPTDNTNLAQTMVPDTSSNGVIITNIDLKAEIVTIKNNSSSTVDLTGWSLLSETGGQTFSFPAGTTISAGETIQILSGSDAVAGSGQLLWGNSNIWNNKGDPGKLYDATGNLVSQY